MTVRVRPFAERDYPAYARIARVSEGEPVDVDSLRALDARWDWSRYERVRVVAADEEDAPLGYGEIHHDPAHFEPRRYFVRLGVEPRMRRRGIGAALWAQLAAELDERRAETACLWARDHTACASFITKRGFREVTRVHHMVIAAARAPVLTASISERLAGGGVGITSLAQLAATDRAALEKAHALDAEARAGERGLGPVTPLPSERWRADVAADPQAVARYLVAMAGDRYVGECVSRPSTRADDVLDVQALAVHPEFRGRGIGRALLLALHGYARAKEYREIHASAVRENEAFVRLSTSLGYAIVESLAGYELAVTPSSP